jgi:hypothetical protein
MEGSSHSSSASGMGDVTFPNRRTVVLKPRLMIQRQQLQQQSFFWPPSPSLPVPLLFFLGFSWALYLPLVVLLEKYRHDFQLEWQQQKQQQQSCLPLPIATIVVGFLDLGADWFLTACPRLASALLILHILLCAAFTVKERRSGGLQRSVSDNTSNNKLD